MLEQIEAGNLSVGLSATLSRIWNGCTHPKFLIFAHSLHILLVTGSCAMAGVVAVVDIVDSLDVEVSGGFPLPVTARRC
jgi:hypothetical protein